jgi:TPR repeat protein
MPSSGLAMPCVCLQATAAHEREDVHRCVDRLLQLLTEGDDPNPLALGLLHYCDCNYPAAHAAFKLAAEDGDAAAQFSWALMLESEALRDSPGSSGEAERYYRLAARQGLALAQFQLGVMMENGEIAADADWVDPLANAVMYYHLAASQGLGLALYSLASCYSNGVGVERSLGVARTYFAQAGAHGQGDAEHEIALLDARIAADEVERRGTGLDRSCAVLVDSD